MHEKDTNFRWWFLSSRMEVVKVVELKQFLLYIYGLKIYF